MRPTLSNTDRAQRILLLATLYFVQGVPYGLFVQALPVVLRQAGTSFEGIGLSTLLALPWMLKFVWAPWVDSQPPFGPRRKGWILPIHTLTMLVLAVLCLVEIDQPDQLPYLLAGILVINFLNASQDIATDGLAVDLLPVEERGSGNALQVGGYRIGMLFGGAGALLVIDQFGWELGIMACIVALGLGIAPLLWMREDHAPGDREDEDGFGVLATFLAQPSAKRIVLLLVAFKFGDALSTGMLRPMLVDMDFTMGDIAVLMGGVGFAAALLGAISGGVIADRLTRRRALLLAVVLQTLGAGLYLIITTPSEPSFEMVGYVVGVEGFMGSVATVILFTCMMDWTRPTHSGADYTLLASVVVAATGLGAVSSGFSVGQLGFTWHFIFSTAVTLLGGVVSVGLYRGALDDE